MVEDDQKSMFTRMEVEYVIDLQFFVTTISLGCQSTASQFFQPLGLQTLVLMAATIYCELSRCASRKKATVVFFQGKFCPSPVIHFTLKPTTLSIERLLGCFAHSHQDNVWLDRHSSISICNVQSSAVQIVFTLNYFAFSTAHSGWPHLNLHQCTLVCNVTAIFHPVLLMTLVSTPQLR